MQSARLLDPRDELAFVEFVVLGDVEVASAFALGLAGEWGSGDAPSKNATFAKQWSPRN
jgi:hypothetical protein